MNNALEPFDLVVALRKGALTKMFSGRTIDELCEAAKALEQEIFARRVEIEVIIASIEAEYDTRKRLYGDRF